MLKDEMKWVEDLVAKAEARAKVANAELLEKILKLEKAVAEKSVKGVKDAKL